MPRVVRPRTARQAMYGPNAVVALIFCWAVLRISAGKQLGPALTDC